MSHGSEASVESRSGWIPILGAIVWIWALYTLYNVSRFGGAVLFDLSTTSRIMGVHDGERIRSAVGLTYHGLPGALLVLVQIGLVVAALLASLSRETTRRRLAGVSLTLWSLLWLVNSIWMETLMGGEHPSDTTMLVLVTVAVGAWTALRWKPVSD